MPDLAGARVDRLRTDWGVQSANEPVCRFRSSAVPSLVIACLRPAGGDGG